MFKNDQTDNVIKYLESTGKNAERVAAPVIINKNGEVVAMYTAMINTADEIAIRGKLDSMQESIYILEAFDDGQVFKIRGNWVES